jgi:hypothetical protein
MLIFGNRKVQQVRGSFFVPLPPEWITSNEMKKSDPVRIELLNDGSLRIVPAPKSDPGSTGTGTPTATTAQRRSAGYDN